MGLPLSDTQGFTRAEMMRHVALLQGIVTRVQRDAAEGMWNPHFCAANAEAEGRRLIAEIRERLDWIETRIAAGRAALAREEGEDGRS